MRVGSEKLLQVELFVSAALLIINSSMAFLTFFLFHQSLAFLSLIFAAIFVAFALLYAMKKDRHSTFQKIDPYTLSMHVLFVAMFLFNFFIFFATRKLGFVLLAQLTLVIEGFVLFFLALLPVFFLAFIGMYLAKREWGRKRIPDLLLFAIIFVVLMIYFFFVLKEVFHADDEELLKLTGINMLLNGTNPYSASIEPLLYQHINTIGATITTNNAIIGVMDYPALFFLLFLPFYFFAAPVTQSLNSVYLPLQTVVFLFIFLLVFAYSLKKKDLKVPSLLLLAISIFAITNISSTTTYLMLSLMMLAYAKIDSRYAWVFLGLCVSVQEELWPAALLLLAYSFNNQGIRRGAYNALGALLLFLLINSYFIAINPLAFVRALFLPLNQYIMPLNPSQFSFFLLKLYPMLMPTYAQLFEIGIAFLLLLFLYWNRKELLFLFSLIPFLLLPHILVSYYAFFLFLFIFSFMLEEKKKEKGVIEKQLRNRKLLFAFLLLALLASAFALAYTSHAAYERNFNISFENESVRIFNASNLTRVSGVISYTNLSNNTVYLFTFTLSGLSSSFTGLINTSIIENPQRCNASDYGCFVNLNKIVLPRDQNRYPINLSIQWPNNTKTVSYVSVAIYNSQYFYVSDGAEAANLSGSS